MTLTYPQHKGHSVVAAERVATGAAVVPLRREPTADDIAAAFLLAYAGNTRAAYRRDLAGWFAWCAERSLSPLDASRGHVDAWARQLEEMDGRSRRRWRGA
jgi:hypothetical protein